MVHGQAKGRSAIVLGAGMVGTATAWHLRQRGFDVVLVDRRAPGNETSFGNAGLIQREAVMPYAFPMDAGRLARIAFGMGNDTAWRARDLPTLAPMLARYFWNSLPGRYDPICMAYERMVRHCLTEHQAMAAQANATGMMRAGGWKQIFQSQAAMKTALHHAKEVAERFGVPHTVLDGATLAREEPALQRQLAGAIHWTSPFAVSDPGGLVKAYARGFEAAGGMLARGDAQTLRPHGAGWRVTGEDGDLDAETTIICLGPWSDTVLRPLGYRFPLFVKRGYHMHVALDAPLATPMLLTEQGVAMLPTPSGLRIATGAEFARREAPAATRQITRSIAIARTLLPIGKPLDAAPWRGARPCLPDMLPALGPCARHPGLWLNFGHAHQGFTLGPVTGRLCAELIAGEVPFIDPMPYDPGRFDRQRLGVLNVAT